MGFFIFKILITRDMANLSKHIKKCPCEQVFLSNHVYKFVILIEKNTTIKKHS